MSREVELVRNAIPRLDDERAAALVAAIDARNDAKAIYRDFGIGPHELSLARLAITMARAKKAHAPDNAGPARGTPPPGPLPQGEGGQEKAGFSVLPPGDRE